MMHIFISFVEILKRLVWNPGKRGRTYCKLHGGENPYSFSYNEEKGFFHCFSCGARGDKIDLVMLALGIGFKEALKWLGVSQQPPKLKNANTSPNKHVKLEQGLNQWARITAKSYRDEFYDKGRIEFYGFKKLQGDHENELGLNLLKIAFEHKTKIEYLLDLLEGTQADKLQAFKLLEGAE